jgi:signal transduction histidine kinase
MRLRTLIFLVVLLASESGLVVGLLVQSSVEASRMAKGLAMQRRAEVERLARVASDAVLDGSEVSLLNYLRTLHDDPRVAYALVTDSAGDVRLDTGLFDGAPLRARWQGFHAAGGPPRAVAGPPRAEEWASRYGQQGALGWVAVGFGTDYAREQDRAAFEESGRRLAAAGAAATLCALFVSTALAWRLSGPLERLAAIASDIGAGDFSRRAEAAGPAEIRALAQGFNAMAGRLSSAEASRLHILSGLTHDLRTPLAAVALNVKLAADPKVPEAERRVSAAAAGEEITRLSRLVDDLTDLAKARMGVLPLRRELVDVAELMEAERRVAQPFARARDVLLEIHHPEKPLPVPADKSHIRRVLANLVSNAVRHTPSGGAVSLMASPDEHHLTVTVNDTGPGIPAALTETLNRRESRDFGGAGLGLRLAKELVAAHGGKLSAKNRTGGGASVAFTLPLAPGECTEDC